MGKREDNKARKRADLQQEALDLFLRQGYAATSIEQVAAAAGVARGTYYLYFDDKEALFRELAAQVLDPATDALLAAQESLETSVSAEAAQAAYLQMGASLAEAIRDNPLVAKLYYRELRNPGPVGDWLRTRSGQLDRFVEALVAALMDRGLLRPAPPRTVALAILGAVDRLTYAWLEGADLGEPEQVTGEVVRLFAQGLVEPAGRSAF